ncbi:MAG: hypothetical protein MI924_13640 [Chloroflexales bacterium]|nr:hypothetical protein [Chloroflexales bacterium]
MEHGVPSCLNGLRAFAFLRPEPCQFGFRPRDPRGKGRLLPLRPGRALYDQAAFAPLDQVLVITEPFYVPHYRKVRDMFPG